MVEYCPWGILLERDQGVEFYPAVLAIEEPIAEEPCAQDEPVFEVDFEVEDDG